MTKQTSDSQKEIEITEQMLVAGVYEFGDYDERFDSAHDLVRRIYLAMRPLEQSVSAPSRKPPAPSSNPSTKQLLNKHCNQAGK